MFRIFLSHQWLSFWRGRNKAAGLVARIVMIIFILYFLLVAIGLGFFMKELIAKFFPGSDVISIFNGAILYYFIADFLLRIQLQELPTLSVQPYLALNIRKKTIVNFLNGKSLFTFFNLLPLILFLPFIFSTIARSYSMSSAIAYAVCIISLMLFNHFLALYLKRKSGSNIFFILIGVSIVIGLAALDYFRIISISNFSDFLFALLDSYTYIAIIFFLLPVFMFYINSRYLRNNLYLEELTRKESAKTATDYPFFNRFGKVGELAALELKLILRHKRSKSALTMSFIFVLYGFLFYKSSLIESNSFAQMMFAAIFMTGIFQIVYGQFMFAWQSSHFDGLMANRIDATSFIKAKFLLFTLAATIVTMLTLLYGFLSWKLALMHICVYLYNIGFGTVIVLYFANYNKKRLDLTKGGSFNWQGVGATQWILGLPLILLPFIIYLPFGANNKPFWGLIAVGLFGLITLAMRDIWIRLLTKLFIKQRYKIAEGFRE